MKLQNLIIFVVVIGFFLFLFTIISDQNKGKLYDGKGIVTGKHTSDYIDPSLNIVQTDYYLELKGTYNMSYQVNPETYFASQVGDSCTYTFCKGYYSGANYSRVISFY